MAKRTHTKIFAIRNSLNLLDKKAKLVHIGGRFGKKKRK